MILSEEGADFQLTADTCIGIMEVSFVEGMISNVWVSCEEAAGFQLRAEF